MQGFGNGNVGWPVRFRPLHVLSRLYLNDPPDIGGQVPPSVVASGSRMRTISYFRLCVLATMPLQRVCYTTHHKAPAKSASLLALFHEFFLESFMIPNGQKMHSYANIPADESAQRRGETHHATRQQVLIFL